MLNETVFCRKLKVSGLGKKPCHIQIQADEAEAQLIADQFQLKSVANFMADLTIKLQGQEEYHISGIVQADITQLCGVSLVPMTYVLTEQIESVFSSNRDRWETTTDIEKVIELSNLIDGEAQEPVDPIIDGIIDLGQLVLEYFLLGLNPYVWATEKAFSMPDEMVQCLDMTSPFAKLSQIKSKSGGDK